MTSKLIKVNTQTQGPVYVGAGGIGNIDTSNQLRVTIKYENNQYIELYYDSSKKGQLTSDSLVSGTTHTLVDTNATFVTDGVEVGDHVRSLRFPDDSYSWSGTVSAVVSETELTIDTSSSGTQPGLGETDQHYMIKSMTQPLNDAGDKIAEAIQLAVSNNNKNMIVDLPECSDKFGPITFIAAVAN